LYKYEHIVVESMRGYRDRDFLQTSEELLFCVVGLVHPHKRVISYLKYVPSESGVWGRGEKRFSRIFQKYTIPNLLKTFNFLERNYPHYLYHSPVDNITLTAVPRQNIEVHFLPEQKLAQLRLALELDSLQDKLIRFSKFLEEISGVPSRSFGVTGSLLLDIHQPKFSDLDVTVYGVKNSWALRNALTESTTSETSVKRLTGKPLEEWCGKKAKQYPLTPAEASRIYERKWNLGFFEDTWCSIHPVKLESEVIERYGEKNYYPCGQVTIRAVVCDNTNSLFLPSVYYLKDVKVLEGQLLGHINEVVSYESLYDSLAENGESIVAKGKLERVVDSVTSREYYRVLVGSPEGKGKEYIKLWD
jgi:predicted nucleotidyltransferase